MPDPRTLQAPAAAPGPAAPTRPRDSDDHPMTGAPVSRLDGIVKTTGAARYAAEVPVEGAAYGALVKSTIARGRIQSVNTREAERAPGVLLVLTAGTVPDDLRTPRGDEPLPILGEREIHFGGQSLGIVVAETLEQARHAAKLVRIEVEVEEPRGDVEALLGEAFVPQGQEESLNLRQGDLDAGRRAADVVIEHDYETPIEHHHPLEPHATVAVWSDAPGEPRLTVYDATQGVSWAQESLAHVFRLEPDQVRVVSRFIGGGFGCKGGTWPHVYLTVLAAREAGRPVRLALTREEMFTSVGFRATTRQRIALGARRDGTLTLHRHEGTSHTSEHGMYVEQTGAVPKMLYACPNREVVQRVVRLTTGTPTYMRAPGEASGSFGLESAVDELAVALGMDPIALRLANEPDVDPETGEPWSSRSVRECYRRGAERFGWGRRTPEPRSMRDGHTLIGYGVATATYPARTRPTSARVSVRSDGTVLVQSGTQDLGTGTYTIMAQVAARVLGVPVESVSSELGDTTLPAAPGSGGSWTAASVSTAVDAAATALRDQLVAAAVGDPDSPLAGLDVAEVGVRDGRVFAWTDAARGEPFADVARRQGGALSAKVETDPAQDGYSKHSFGANFCEVHVDEDFGEVRVARFHGVYGAGRILNEKTARSQFLGGIIWGISMALMEESPLDARYARYAGATLADYHVPVHADVRELTVDWVEEEDPHVNPMGVKGVGEIGIVGVAAAVANAVAHATGRRVRSLPLTPDKVLAAPLA